MTDETEVPPEVLQYREDCRRWPVVATPAVLAAVSKRALSQALQRHQAGEDGTLLDAHDIEQNRIGRATGDCMVLTTWKDAEGTVFWIITDAHEPGQPSHTTILLPEDY